jgi:hypothetical protein
MTSHGAANPRTLVHPAGASAPPARPGRSPRSGGAAAPETAGNGGNPRIAQCPVLTRVKVRVRGACGARGLTPPCFAGLPLSRRRGAKAALCAGLRAPSPPGEGTAAPAARGEARRRGALLPASYSGFQAVCAALTRKGSWYRLLDDARLTWAHPAPNEYDPFRAGVMACGTGPNGAKPAPGKCHARPVAPGSRSFCPQ